MHTRGLAISGSAKGFVHAEHADKDATIVDGDLDAAAASLKEKDALLERRIDGDWWLMLDMPADGEIIVRPDTAVPLSVWCPRPTRAGTSLRIPDFRVTRSIYVYMRLATRSPVFSNWYSEGNPATR